MYKKEILTCEKIEQYETFTLKSKGLDELKCWPEGNLVLKEKAESKYIQDSFVHEQYIVIHENEKSVLISGCAHNGILNILEENKAYSEMIRDLVEKAETIPGTEEHINEVMKALNMRVQMNNLLKMAIEAEEAFDF